jgi:hypothetical protein
MTAYQLHLPVLIFSGWTALARGLAGNYRELAAIATFRLLSISVLKFVYGLDLQEGTSDFHDLMRWTEPLKFDVRSNIERFVDPTQK